MDRGLRKYGQTFHVIRLANGEFGMLNELFFLISNNRESERGKKGRFYGICKIV